MTTRISQILILGATRGIGLALARRFHALDKKVIITGRAQDEGKMQQSAKELPGLEYRVVRSLFHLPPCNPPTPPNPYPRPTT